MSALKPLTDKERIPILVAIATLDDNEAIDQYLQKNGIQIVNSVYYWTNKITKENIKC